MLYGKEMEIAKEIIVAQINSATNYVNTGAVAESLEAIFNKVKSLTSDENRTPRTLL